MYYFHVKLWIIGHEKGNPWKHSLWWNRMHPYMLNVILWGEASLTLVIGHTQETSGSRDELKILSFQDEKRNRHARSKQEWTQSPAGPEETERGTRNVDLRVIHSLNTLMWHRTETSFLLKKRTLAEAPAPCKGGWGKGLRVAMAHVELAPSGAGIHKHSLRTRAKQHTDPPGKAS